MMSCISAGIYLTVSQNFNRRKDEIILLISWLCLNCHETSLDWKSKEKVEVTQRYGVQFFCKFIVTETGDLSVKVGYGYIWLKNDLNCNVVVREEIKIHSAQNVILLLFRIERDHELATMEKSWRRDRIDGQFSRLEKQFLDSFFRIEENQIFMNNYAAALLIRKLRYFW